MSRCSTTRDGLVSEIAEGGGWIARGVMADLPRWTRQVPEESHRVVVVPGAVHLDPEAFTAATHSAYEMLFHDVDPESIARVWNFIPQINDVVSKDIDRYMTFNAGRFQAYEAAFSCRTLHPVASGVGHAGEDLVLHALHGAASVERVSNSRQHEPHAYTRRFGPQPPAFSRAAIASFSEGSWFLVSGTASVVGEASFHHEDAHAQTHETIKNLLALLEEAPEPVRYTKETDWLVYLPDECLAGHVTKELVNRCNASPEHIVLRQQALCRPELLVEIECAVRMGGVKA